MWKAFEELAGLGWLEPISAGAGGRAAGRDRRPFPRMICCQSSGCDPLARAWRAGQRFADPFPDARTIAAGLRVSSAVGDFMILDAVRASQGTALAVTESRIREWMRLVATLEGIAICPETAACIGALEQLTQSGWIRPEERVVVFNTGAAQKYIEAISADLPRLDIRQPIDWDWLSEA